MKVLGKIEGPQDAVNKEYVDSLLEPGGGGEQPEGDYATKEELTNLTNEIIDNEEVTAAALIDHENRVANLEDGIPSTYTKKQSFDTAIQELTQNIIDNEEITAAALIDLCKRVEANKKEVKDTYAEKATTNESIDNLKAEVIDNEEVTAAALIYLINQIKSLDARLRALENN